MTRENRLQLDASIQAKQLDDARADGGGGQHVWLSLESGITFGSTQFDLQFEDQC
jgi:hypothetical protein